MPFLVVVLAARPPVRQPENLIWGRPGAHTQRVPGVAPRPHQICQINPHISNGAGLRGSYALFSDLLVRLSSCGEQGARTGCGQCWRLLVNKTTISRLSVAANAT